MPKHRLLSPFLGGLAVTTLMFILWSATKVAEILMVFELHELLGFIIFLLLSGALWRVARVSFSKITLRQAVTLSLCFNIVGVFWLVDSSEKYRDKKALRELRPSRTHEETSSSSLRDAEWEINAARSARLEAYLEFLKMDSEVRRASERYQSLKQPDGETLVDVMAGVFLWLILLIPPVTLVIGMLLAFRFSGTETMDVALY
jgi:hypothetical protein